MVPLDQRALALDAAVSRAARDGGRLVTQGQTEAVLEYGQRPNHVLHAILSIFTCGLWVLVWLVLGLTMNVVRRTIVVDEYGRTWISDRSGMREF
jgi:hypothetical protein